MGDLPKRVKVGTQLDLSLDIKLRSGICVLGFNLIHMQIHSQQRPSVVGYACSPTFHSHTYLYVNSVQAGATYLPAELTLCEPRMWDCQVRLSLLFINLKI